MQKTRSQLRRFPGWIAVLAIVMILAVSGLSVWADVRNGASVAGPPVTFGAELVQNKVLAGSDGEVAVLVTLTVGNMMTAAEGTARDTDLVIVLDRSGSMSGKKINDAREAVLRLMDRLTPRDRLSLVTYSTDTRTAFPLVFMNEANRRFARSALGEILASGGTNLGSGLQQGIGAFPNVAAPIPPSDLETDRQRTLILISDGLANHGITDPIALGRMAAGAAANAVTVSTVGVGLDFNELLMTTIADHGTGRYYFLENPNAFARVFEKALNETRRVAASGLEIRVPLGEGLQLVHAGGYPVTIQNGVAVVRPGDLLAGQRRSLFLTFRVPTDRERDIRLGTLDMSYLQNGEKVNQRSPKALTLSCVPDRREVVSSIDPATWGEQVVQEDFSRLQESVATSIRKGEKKEALEKIQAYEERNREINAAVQSAKVTDNLDESVKGLRQRVEETFAGSATAVTEKKKQTSKALQYEGYKTRRDKK